MAKKIAYYIKTFGCQANEADSERLHTVLQERGMKKASSINSADYVVINTCIVRESAENRVFGLIHNLGKRRSEKGRPLKVVLTGCMVGLMTRDKTGKMMRKYKRKLRDVDEFLFIDEVGFDYIPTRTRPDIALVPISNGCNNFCSFCIVPFTRGKEVSRPFEEIIEECRQLKDEGFKEIMLLGQNVNSYGSDLVKKLSSEVVNSGVVNSKAVNREVVDSKAVNSEVVNSKIVSREGGNRKQIQPVFVKHLGKYRIPTLFPLLLEEVAKIRFEKVDFMSSNPWDFSDELIDVIARNENITRTIHLPIQSGDDEVLKRMNRWYTSEEYLRLIKKIRKEIPDVKFTTDIIVGFPGEKKKQFENTIELCRKVVFKRAFVSRYSPRIMTRAFKEFEDNVPHEEKKRRWSVIEKLVNS